MGEIEFRYTPNVRIYFVKINHGNNLLKIEIAYRIRTICNLPSGYIILRIE
jgi:hypothetical protein